MSVSAKFLLESYSFFGFFSQKKKDFSFPKTSCNNAGSTVYESLTKCQMFNLSFSLEWGIIAHSHLF